MNPDLNNQIHVARGSSPQAILAGNATLTSQIIDRAGFESLEFVIPAGALTDGLYTCTVFEDTASNMAGEAAAADVDLIGQTNAFVITGTAGADSNKVFKVGYKGHKRYVRLKIVQSGATTGGYICSVVVQANPRFLPTT